MSSKFKAVTHCIFDMDGLLLGKKFKNLIFKQFFNDYQN